MCVCNCVKLYLSHYCNGGLSFGLSHPVLNQIIHVLIVQQADQMKGTETSCTSQGQVPYYHGTAKGRRVNRKNNVTHISCKYARKTGSDSLFRYHNDECETADFRYSSMYFRFNISRDLLTIIITKTFKSKVVIFIYMAKWLFNVFKDFTSKFPQEPTKMMVEVFKTETNRKDWGFHYMWLSGNK